MNELSEILRNIVLMFGKNKEILSETKGLKESVDTINDTLENTSNPNTDDAGRKSLNTVFGQQITATEISSFNALFAYPSDTRKLITTLNGTGTAGQDNYMLKIGTGTGIDGSSIASSKRALQYRPGHEGYCKFTSIFTQGKANSNQRFGLIDELNGFAIGFAGTDFAVFRKRNGVMEEVITQLNFNRDTLDGNGKSGFLIDPTKGNVYRISFGFLGFATITFEILAGAENSWIPFHVIDYPNKFIETHITIPYLKLRAEVENTGNDTDINIWSGSVEVGVVNGGGSETSTRDFAFPLDNFAFTAGTNQKIVVFHNKDTYGGISNRIETLLRLVTAAVEANKSIIIKIDKLTQAPTGGTWNDISSNSVMEYSLDTVIDLTNKELMIPIAMSKTGNFFQLVESLNLRLLPGDYAAIIFSSTGVGDLSLAIRWSELF